jgi:hypothetical protein
MRTRRKTRGIKTLPLIIGEIIFPQNKAKVIIPYQLGEEPKPPQ